jgi:Predicted endonuclease containing a URI domain
MAYRNYTYIVECSDGRLYTGWTNCIEKRINEHNSGRGAKFTRGRVPVTLRYLEISQTKSDAMKREAAIKKLSHAQKQKLIQQGHLEKILEEYNISI